MGVKMPLEKIIIKKVVEVIIIRSGGITMMIIVAIIIICITIGMFYTSEKRKMKSVENATLVTIKRERVVILWV